MDNCTGQNKNFSLHSAILSYMNSAESGITETVELKYLVPGHTYMAADGIHGRIEQIMRKQLNVYDFDQFVDICQQSSKRMTVVLMQPADFMPLKNILKSRSKNYNFPYFNEVVHVRFENNSNAIFYKNDFNTTEFKKSVNVIKRSASFIPIAAVC